MSEKNIIPNSSKGPPVEVSAKQRPIPRNVAAGRQAESSQSISIQFVLSALLQWWKLAFPAGLMIAALAVACVYGLFKPVYKATAVLQIDSTAPYFIFRAYEDSNSAQRYVSTEIAKMRHPSLVVGPVVRRPEIADLPEFEELVEEAERIAWVVQRLDFTNLGDSDLYELSIECPNAESASLIVNAVTEEYFDARRKEEAEKRQLVVALLQAEQDRRTAEITRAWDTVTELTKQVHGTTGIAPNAVGHPGQAQTPLAGLQTGLINAEVELEVLRAEFDAASQMASGEAASDDAASTGQITVSDARIKAAVAQDPQVVMLEGELAAWEAALRDREKRLVTPEKDTTCLEMRDEVAAMRESLDEYQEEFRKRFRDGLQEGIGAPPINDLAGMQYALRRQGYLVQALKGRLDTERKNAERTGGNEVELESRRNELTRALGVHDRIADRILELEVEGGASDRVTRLSEAAIPTSPIEAIPLRNMGMAAMAGLFLPFGLAILWEHLIRRVGSPQNLDQDARLTVVGEIASLPVSTRKALSARRERERRVFEESVDGLATNLMLSDAFRDISVLAVTSAVKHEGKTSLTVTLARSFARIFKEPVLVIDADTRSPDMHEIFGIPLEPGFVDILEDRCSLKDAIVTDETDTVHVIPAGRLKSGPHSLAAKGRLERLLKEVSGSYRYVVIDTPPVLSASESLAFAKAADACIVCAMRNVSRVDRVKRAVERLEGVGARTIGTVFSGVPTKRYAQRYDTYEYASE